MERIPVVKNLWRWNNFVGSFSISYLFIIVISKSWECDLEYMGQGPKSLCMAYLLSEVNTCTKYEKDPSSEKEVVERAQFHLRANGQANGWIKWNKDTPSNWLAGVITTQHPMFYGRHMISNIYISVIKWVMCVYVFYIADTFTILHVSFMVCLYSAIAIFDMVLLLLFLFLLLLLLL